MWALHRCNGNMCVRAFTRIVGCQNVACVRDIDHFVTVVAISGWRQKRQEINEA